MLCRRLWQGRLLGRHGIERLDNPKALAAHTAEHCRELYLLATVGTGETHWRNPADTRSGWSMGFRLWKSSSLW
jgi:hypothetical protein